jgi:hypothetical protein
MYKLTALLLLASSVVAMDKTASFEEICKKLKDEKVKKYSEKVDRKFTELQNLVSDSSKISDELKKRPLSKLYTKEKYAPLLELFLQEKKIDANFQWDIQFCRMMMPCNARYSLLGVALQCKAVRNAQLLVEYGAGVTFVCNDLDRSWTRLIRPLVESVQLNDPQLVKAILKEKPDLKNTGRAVAEFPLSIALARLCSDQNGVERDKAWNIVQALTKAGANYLEKSKYYEEQAVDISDGQRKYRIIPETPLDIVRTYNHHFNNKLALVETHLTGRSQPQGRGSVSYVQDKP